MNIHRIALLAGVLAPALAAQDVFEAAEHGFRLTPAPGWQVTPEQDGARYIVHLRAEPDGGPVGMRVTVAPDSGGGAEAMLREALQQTDGREPYSDLERITQQIAGQSAPGIAVTYREPKLGRFRIRQHYLAAHGLRYTLQCHAPVEAAGRHTDAFAAVLASFALTDVPAAVVARAPLRALAARCGSEVDWQPSWAAASVQARQRGRAVLVVVRRYPGFTIPDTMRMGVFMDPDVIELVGERFVALRLVDGMAVPFRAQSSYGMGPNTFGNALLVVSPDGAVLAETHSENPFVCYAFLIEALQALPQFAGSEYDAADDALARAQHAVRRGELSRAEELVAPLESTAAARLRAEICRRQRRARPALRALGAAGDGTALREVVLHMRAGDDAAAASALDRLPAETKASPEALFWRGAQALRTGQRDAGVALLQALTQQHPEDRWAWHAAGVLISPGFVKGGTIATAWPERDVVGALRNPVAAEPGAALETVVGDALEFLLASQRDDGSWISPSEASLGRPHLTNPFVVAITALAGRCLLPRRDGAEVDAAIERALGFVLRSHQTAKSHPPKVAFMDYTVWSGSLCLWFLADCIDSGTGDAKAVRAVIAEKVANLAGKRRPSGGWSYYVTGDLAQQAGVPPEAMSFTTAAVVMGLLRARDVGADVAADVLDGALACLERARNDNGTFDYSIGSQKGPRKTRRPGAAGRGPLCELALLRGGRGSTRALREGLEIFRAHCDGLHKELGKALMHAGPGAQGCHYLMFDYATAAMAAARLPEDERARYRDVLLDLLLPARSVEGGFRDTSINGWAFGTAMALTAFRELGIG